MASVLITFVMLLVVGLVQLIIALFETERFTAPAAHLITFAFCPSLRIWPCSLYDRTLSPQCNAMCVIRAVCAYSCLVLCTYESVVQPSAMGFEPSRMLVLSKTYFHLLWIRWAFECYLAACEHTNVIAWAITALPRQTEHIVYAMLLCSQLA